MATTPVCEDIALMDETTDWRLMSMLLVDDSDIVMAFPFSVRVPEMVALLVTAEPVTVLGLTEAETPVVLLMVLMDVALAMAEPALLANERLSLLATEVGTL